MTKLEKNLTDSKNLADAKGLISIARKAGYVIAGSENLIGYSKKLYLVILDESAGNSLRREAKFLCEKTGAELLVVSGVEDFVKIEKCKIFAIKNKNLGEKIASAMKGE